MASATSPLVGLPALGKLFEHMFTLNSVSSEMAVMGALSSYVQPKEILGPPPLGAVGRMLVLNADFSSSMSYRLQSVHWT